jgi:hypothetical protein
MNKAFNEMRSCLKDSVERFQKATTGFENECLDCNYPIRIFMTNLQTPRDMLNDMETIAYNPVAETRDAEVKKFKDHLQAMVEAVELARKECSEKHCFCFIITLLGATPSSWSTFVHFINLIS